jgi:hypothetical protein
MNHSKHNPELQPGVFSRTERDRYAKADPIEREELLLEAKRRVAAFDADAFPARALPERTDRCYWFRCGSPSCSSHRDGTRWPIFEYRTRTGFGLAEMGWEKYRPVLYEVPDGDVWWCSRCRTLAGQKPERVTNGLAVATSAPAVCDTCSEVFEAQRSSARYCSDDCKVRARLARKRVATPKLQRRRSRRSR